LGAAGIKPTPGGAKLPAESRPYPVTARNAWESSSRRFPCCPVLLQSIPYAPATYVKHGWAAHLPPLDIPGCMASCSCSRPERATRSRCWVPVPGVAAAGVSALTLRELNRRNAAGASRGASSLDTRLPLGSRASCPCPGTVRGRAPTGTATALGAIHRTEQRPPCSPPQSSPNRNSRTPEALCAPQVRASPLHQPREKRQEHATSRLQLAP